MVISKSRTRVCGQCFCWSLIGELGFGNIKFLLSGVYVCIIVVDLSIVCSGWFTIHVVWHVLCVLEG